MTDESKFPTINDFVEQLQRVQAHGLGGLPAQVLVAPESTLAAINRTFGGANGTRALLVELCDPTAKKGPRLPPSILSSGYVGGAMFGRVPLSGKPN